MGFNILYWHLVRYGIYLILWHIFECCKNVYRSFKGNSKNAAKQARVHKILFRFQRMPAEIARREDFVTADDGFISVEVLTGPNWSVYSLDKKGALFVEMPKPISSYSIEKCPFIYPYLFEDSIRVAEIDLQTYFKFGNELERDYKPPKCLFFTNTARSASTLFGSMLQHEDHSTVISEHPALSTIAIKFCQGYLSKKEVAELLNPTIKLLRKNFPADHLLVFKTRSTEAFLVPFLAKQFPEMQHIFMFRKNGLESVERMMSRGGSVFLFICHIYFYFPKFTTFFVSLIWETFRKLKPKSHKEVAMIVYAEPYSNYKKNKDLYDFPVVWQDELIATPEKVLAPIFDKLGIPASCIPSALDRMNYDSQDGTYLSQKLLKAISATEITPELKEKILDYAKHFQMESSVLGFGDN